MAGQGNWYQNTGLVDGSQLGMRQDWGISLNTAGQVAAGIGRDLMEPATTVYSSSTGLNDGQLHVATFTRQQGTIQLYVDGGSANLRSDADDRPRSSQGLAIGSLLTQQGFFSGQIGEVRVYNGCLSTEEVSQLTSQVVTYYSNQLPVASADEYRLSEDQVLAVSAAEGVLANDVDGDGDSLTAVLVQPAAHGQLDLKADGSFTYRPAADFAGEDVFSYRSSDGIGRSAEVVVRIEVQPVNDRPLAQPDTYVGLMNEVLRIGVPQGVLANDVDVDGPSLQAILTAGPAHGRVDLQHDGSFVYTPDPGFVGLDQFSYRATDSLSATEPVVVTIQTTTQPILINEFMASNAETVETRLRTDTSRAFEGEVLSPDWIELRNVLSQPWDLGGLYLTDDAQLPQKWQFPVGTIVAPDGYLVVFASGREVRDPAFDERGWLHTTFELSSSPGYLALVSTGRQGDPRVCLPAAAHSHQLRRAGPGSPSGRLLCATHARCSEWYPAHRIGGRHAIQRRPRFLYRADSSPDHDRHTGSHDPLHDRRHTAQRHTRPDLHRSADDRSHDDAAGRGLSRGAGHHECRHAVVHLREGCGRADGAVHAGGRLSQQLARHVTGLRHG